MADNKKTPDTYQVFSLTDIKGIDGDVRKRAVEIEGLTSVGDNWLPVSENPLFK
jgi:hypothetical protein